MDTLAKVSCLPRKGKAMTSRDELVERVARAIYHAAYDPTVNPKSPSPGWCWEKCGHIQQEFAKRQARAAIAECEKDRYALGRKPCPMK